MNNKNQPRPGTLIGLLALLAMLASSDLSMAAAHGKTYWQAISANDFTPPTDVPLASLVEELSDHLGSPDPEMRDEVAYSILTQWLYVKQIVPVELRMALIAEWIENLGNGTGERDTDTVLVRSFSALMLSVAAALDNEVPYLDRQAFATLLDASIAYLQDERDTRGYDAAKGWLHSVAHTADLLKFLGRSRHLEASEQSAILTAIAGKLTEVDHVLAHGEDERLARAVVSIAAREDVDMAAFDSFLAALEQVRSGSLPTPVELARNQNRKHVAVSLYAVLNTDSRNLETLRTARAKVLALLKTMM